MGRKDWEYIALSKKQLKFFEDIVEREGAKYGIHTRTELVRMILQRFQTSYEKNTPFAHALEEI